jgi:hypothetical protein
VNFLRYLLPLLSPSFDPPNHDEVFTKVSSNLDYYLPFRQHAPSLANARHHIYADHDRLSSEDGVGFFNILAFRGVFFGSPFAKSNRFQWFNSLADWEGFREKGKEQANKYKGEEYYVNKNCYGQFQSGRQLSLLSSYWDLRKTWKDMFDKSKKIPTVTKVIRWLSDSKDNSDSQKNTTLFPNIGKLSALLICADLVEAGILPMPPAKEWADCVAKTAMGSKAGMENCGMVKKKSSRVDFCLAFASLDEALQIELTEEEKETMGYNVVMLEHTLCKINRIGVNLF